ADLSATSGLARLRRSAARGSRRPPRRGIRIVSSPYESLLKQSQGCVVQCAPTKGVSLQDTTAANRRLYDNGPVRIFGRILLRHSRVNRHCYGLPAPEVFDLFADAEVRLGAQLLAALAKD